MHASLIGLVASAGLASSAMGQCTAGTQPVQLSVYGWTGNVIGSTMFAADDGVVACDYKWLSGGSFIPFVQVFRRTATGWSNPYAFGAFKPVTRLALKGNTIAWGAAVERYGTDTYPAEVMVFVGSTPGPSWDLGTRITAPNTTELQFGQGLSLGPAIPAGATQTMVFGTVQDASPSEVLFSYALDAEGVATLEETIADPEPSVDHGFGRKTSLDADRLAVAACCDDQAGPNAGAVYIYRRVAGAWTLVQKIIPDATTISTHFGQSLDMRDGRLIVGAVRTEAGVDDVPANLSFARGFSRIYAWNGTAFDLEAHLTHPNPPTPPQIEIAGFGHSVSIRGDRALVGAPQDRASGTGSGAAFLYQRNGGVWQSRGTLGLPNSGGGWVGSVVGLSSDFAFVNGPLYNQGHLAVAVFDRCALPPAPGEPARCMPGLPGLISFLMVWFQLDPVADFDGDGAVSPQDIFAFLNAWMAGCP